MKTCKTCIYFVERTGHKEEGTCHRYPRPLAKGLDGKRAWGELPLVFNNDYCGEYRGEGTK